MAQRPTIKKPTPLSQPADPVMGGVNIPKFSAEMQAEVSPEAAPLWNFVLTHARKIAAGVVVVVVAILAVACWQWYREGQVADERFALGRITSIQDPARRAAALEGFLKDAPSALGTATQLELASTAVEMQNWEKAAAAYAAVADLEGDTPLAYAARLNHAQVLMHKGDFAAARDEFRALAAEAPAEAAAVMHQQVAEAAEAAGDKAGALAAYEAAVAALPPADQESAAFLRARIAELRK
ncbi:tetratricopeptide repeat protein [Mailhella massiliensis]|uniref:Tetratricopeptide repeat protein n=1 Tax=Mailhella massiliensis TaxID=1903261 RepID=A0A921AU40_9BACT|nr:tetratricopeptide repeat protein [Mailhella massiliensis]HJD96417.1 tetratricopeptide repeat protein [Mailhella massiliensis]